MSLNSFEIWWSQYSDKSLEERRSSFESLPNNERTKLIQAMFEGQWHELFFQNMVDSLLDQIKNDYGIDLIDLHIQVTKLHTVFYIDKETWDKVYSQVMFYSDNYDTNLLFGGLYIELSGRNKDLYRISNKRS